MGTYSDKLRSTGATSVLVEWEPSFLSSSVVLFFSGQSSCMPKDEGGFCVKEHGYRVNFWIIESLIDPLR